MKPVEFMKQSMFFRKCSFCNVFEITDKQPSGDILHAHDYTQIWYVTKGRCRHYVENQIYELTAGDTFLIPPLVEHKTVLAPDSRIISCEMSLEAIFPTQEGQSDLQSYLDQMSVMSFLQDSKTRQPLFRFRPEVIGRVDRLMREMLEEFRGEQPCYQDMLRLKIQELLLLYIREMTVSPDYRATNAIYERYRDLMERAVDYIDSHYTQPLSLEEVCRISSLSKTYFCYLFKLTTKKTFVEYITERRIQGAMQMLESQDCSIQSVCDQMGFRDAASFSRTFKKSVGISPRAYRKMRLPGNAEEGNHEL